MKNAKLECDRLITQWDSLSKQRPGEMDFRPFGYSDINGSSFGVVFSNWGATLAQLVQKTKPVSSDDGQVADAVLTRIFRDLAQHLSGAQGNGVAWLIQSTPFLQFVADAQAYMTQCVERRIVLRKELFKFAEAQLSNQILDVEKAAPIASYILDQHDQIKQDALALNQAKSTADEALNDISGFKSNAETELSTLRTLWEKSQAEITEITDAVKQDKAAIAEEAIDLSKKLQAAEALLASIQNQQIKSDSQIEKGTNQIALANEKLNKALQDINRQGLAGAFTQQVEKIKDERVLWVMLFLGCIGWLLGVGWFVTKDADPKLLFDWHNLLKGLPFVAPAIWLGWVSVRQAGTLSRIQQDYSYKAATALAFETHKKEIAAANDEALSKQLLETTVRNFGENPIRLYRKADEHAMPIEQLISSVKDDSTWSKIIELIKAVKPELKK